MWDHFATKYAISTPVFNKIQFAHVVDLLIRELSPVIVNRALRAAGISQKVLKEGPGFLLYGLQAIIVEYVARAIGDQQLGARIAQQFDCSANGAYGVRRHDKLALWRDEERAPSMSHEGSLDDYISD